MNRLNKYYFGWLVVALFAIKWLPQGPRQAQPILAMQAGTGLAVLAPVAYFHW